MLNDNQPLEKIFSVSEFIEILNIFLKKDEVRIIGEVTQVQFPASGHVYFSIKDKNGEASLSCIIWKGVYARCAVNIETGMELILTGCPNIYAPTGRISFVASAIELHGEGALKKAYDELKKKLETEGIFAQERKKILPELIHKIGVITSKEGAVIHDFENNLGKFGYEINFVDSRVEGQQAVKSLIEAVRTLKKKDIEVLVIIRGGGSLESLQGFNNEMLIREIIDFRVPVIAGIGHDKDVPLMALAADYMVSTPTAAAHLLNVSWEEAYSKIQQVPHLLTRISEQFKKIRMDLDLAWNTILNHTKDGISAVTEILKFADQSIRLNDPTRQLKLGYSLVRKNGKIIKSVRGLNIGEQLNIEVEDGSLVTKIDIINS
ncbi:MAG: exodeoxyribonuclease VII large subunit [bacterium]|nr:exodeoxyribonuclease VII large subunit [bacterium]